MVAYRPNGSIRNWETYSCRSRITYPKMPATSPIPAFTIWDSLRLKKPRPGWEAH